MVTPITFPGFGLSFSIDRVAFSLGNKPIYWYGIIIACGFILAVFYASRICRRYGITEDNLLDMLLFALPLGIIGARIYYVIFYLSLYKNADGSIDWGETIAIWDGGLAIYGGIIASALTVVVFCKVRKIPAGALLDVGAFGLLIGQAIGRWGNFCNQEAYGSATTLPWRMGLVVGGSTIEVHPTFLYESLWNVVGFVLLCLLSRRRKYDGQMFTTYVGWYGLGRLWIEGLRTDSLYFFGLNLFGYPVRTSQMLALLSLLAAVGLLVWQLKFRNHTPEDLFVNRVTLPAPKGRGKEPTQ
jgi:phosphatidylglycerol:prolipoprotein diacylglycerol transferase